MRGVKLLRDDGEQWHAFRARSIIRGPPADAGFAVLQAGVPSRFPTEENGTRQGRTWVFLNFSYNYGSGCFKVMDAETKMAVHSRGVTWYQPQKLSVFEIRLHS